MLVTTASGLALAFSWLSLKELRRGRFTRIDFMQKFGSLSIGIHSICRFRRTRLFRQRARSHPFQKTKKMFVNVLVCMNNEISKVEIREIADFHTHTNLFESRISNKQTTTPGAHEPRRATSMHVNKKRTEINHRRGGEPELDEQFRFAHNFDSDKSREE